MGTIADSLTAIRSTLPAEVELVAVSKFHPAEAIEEAYAAGQRIFGESRVQELTKKIPVLPSDIRWHFIGHLQTNKVRQLLSAGPIALIESIDSEHLLDAVDKEALRLGRRNQIRLHAGRASGIFPPAPFREPEGHTHLRRNGNGHQHRRRGAHTC